MGVSIKSPRLSTRTVKIALTPEMLNNMLDLPHGAGVVAVQTDMDPVRIEILVQSEDFPEKANPEMSSPILPAMAETIEEDTDHDDGTEETRVVGVKYFWDWPTSDDSD